MRTRLIIIIACFLTISWVIIPVSHAQEKVGYINLKRLVNESTMGKTARAEIQKLRTEKEALLKDKLKEINDLRDLINKEGDKMDAATRQERTKALNKAAKISTDHPVVISKFIENAKETLQPRLPFQEPLRMELQHFADCILEKKKLPRIIFSVRPSPMSGLEDVSRSGKNSLKVTVNFPAKKHAEALVENFEYFNWAPYREILCDVYAPKNAPAGLKAPM
jgi:mRNA-degrading endonuclease RelE of RelBE toxin-antitoxin system